jgi:hypothetical protein
VNYSDDFSDDGEILSVPYTVRTLVPAADLQVEHTEPDVIIGTSIPKPDPWDFAIAENDEECTFYGCETKIEHGKTYYVPPCNHFHCARCIAKAQLNQCMRCNQKFITAKAVIAVKIKVEDEN